MHLVLYHLIRTADCENIVEGLKFFHWRSVCEEIERHWDILWDRDRGGNWQTSVAAAFSTYTGRRFQSGKEVKASLAGFWTLIDVVAPADVEPPQERPAEYIFVNGHLVPIETDTGIGKTVEDKSAVAAAHEREARRLRKQMRKLAASYVFSNTDFDRPNPPTKEIAISQLSTHTAPQIQVEQDGWTLKNAAGYCMARTTHGIDIPGQWYFEVFVHRDPVR